MSRQLSLANFFGKRRVESSSSSESEEPSTSVSKPIQASKTRKVAKRRFNENWSRDFQWVRFNEESGLMFCSVCERFPNIADKKTKLVQGTDVLKRETLVLHAKSKAHIKCEEAKKAADKPCEQPLARAARRMIATKYKHLTVLFNTSYYVAKQNLSFMSFSSLCELQRKNSLPVEDLYVNNQKCGEFISHIATVLRQETQSNLTEAQVPFSIICDSSTDRALMENCNIYVRFPNESAPKTMLWEVATLAHSDADGYFAKIKASFGDDETWNKLKKHVIALGADGASVMSGSEGGLYGKIKQEIPKVIFIHCSAHRLQLALQDAWKKIPYMTTFDSTIRNVYALYHRSPKKTTQLQEIAAICEQKVNQFHTIHAVRWVASKHRATKALLTNLKPTILHLQNMGAENTVDGATARGLLNTVSSYKFISYLHFITDYLDPLEQLSICLQKDTIVAAQLPHIIDSSIVRLNNLKASPKSGSFSELFFNEVGETNIFKDIELRGNETSNSFVEQTQKLVTETISAIQKRLLDDEDETVRACRIFDPRTWSKTKDKMALLNKVFHRFEHLLSHDATTGKAHQEWSSIESHITTLPATQHKYSQVHDFIIANSSENPTMHSLLNLMLSLPVSSACCERGFSAITRIKTVYRTSLLPQTLDNLMQISINGPPISDFDPSPAIDHWYFETQGHKHVHGHKSQKIRKRRAKKNTEKEIDTEEESDTKESDSEDDTQVYS